MKLETTLEERPGFLHALPAFDLFMLMVMLLMMGPMFLSQSGVAVELPESEFQMQRYRQAIVVTLGAGDGTPQLHLGRQAVTMEELRQRLEELSEDEIMSRAVVLLKTDVGASVGTEREITEMILGSGFRMALVGKTRPAVDPRTEEETRTDD